MADTVPFFDGHNDFLLRLMHAHELRQDVWLGHGQEAGHLDLERMQQAGFAGGLFAIFVPSPSSGSALSFLDAMAAPPYELPLPAPLPHAQAQPVALSMAGLLLWMQRVTPEAFAVCRSGAEVRSAIAENRIAGVMHLEGAEAIDPDLDALYLFHEMGLRSLGPVWSRPTAFGHGVPLAFPGNPDTGPGLTDKGKELIRRCNQLGILIDLSHLNEAGFNDVVALSQAPLVATHSNAHALCHSPRNLTDRQLHQIRESGGMVGLNFATIFLNSDGSSSTTSGWDPLLRHMDYLIEHLGEDHVGLGSDFDGCGVPDVIGDVRGVPKLFDALSAHGYDDALIAKLARENWLSCLDRSLQPTA